MAWRKVSVQVDMVHGSLLKLAQHSGDFQIVHYGDTQAHQQIPGIEMVAPGAGF